MELGLNMFGVFCLKKRFFIAIISIFVNNRLVQESSQTQEKQRQLRLIKIKARLNSRRAFFIRFQTNSFSVLISKGLKLRVMISGSIEPAISFSNRSVYTALFTSNPVITRATAELPSASYSRRIIPESSSARFTVSITTLGLSTDANE